MMRNTVHMVLIVAVTAGLYLLLGFTASNNVRTPCRSVDIRVKSQSGNYFISAQHLENSIIAKTDSITGRTIGQNLLQSICDHVNSNPFVAQANVYRTINGNISIEATLRDPLIRVIDNNNRSYYIDTGGTMFPLARDHTARVLLATGRIQAPFAAGTNVLCREAAAETPSLTLLQELYQLAMYVRSDPFWDAIIDHIVVLRGGRFELIPKNGMHVIEFGKAENIEKKFSKLRTFYINGLPEVGWYHYRRVNIEFAGQVVCSR